MAGSVTEVQGKVSLKRVVRGWRERKAVGIRVSDKDVANRVGNVSTHPAPRSVGFLHTNKEPLGTSCVATIQLNSNAVAGERAQIPQVRDQAIGLHP